MEGPLEFVQGIASGTEHLLGSAVGGAAGAVSKITDVISKSLAKLTFDEDYQNARIQRKELTKQTTYGVVHSGKNVVKVCCTASYFNINIYFEIGRCEWCDGCC
jgi:vacuolar protein sorting-associated protein 13A/C